MFGNEKPIDVNIWLMPLSHLCFVQLTFLSVMGFEEVSYEAHTQ